MKKVISLILALSLVCTSFAGCSGSPAGSGASLSAASATAESGKISGGEKFKLGVLAPSVTHGWVAGVAYYAETYCKELSGSGEIEYRLLTSSNTEEMTSQIAELKSWGAQAVVAYPQWKGMEVPLQDLTDAGIPVISFNITVDAGGIYRVSGDNEDMGRQSAQYIVDKIGTTGKVIMLNVPASGSVSEQRQKGFEEKLAEIAPDLEIDAYATQFSSEDGLKDFSEILANTDRIDAVFSIDDSTSIGVLNAIKEAGRTDIKVVTGGGGMQEYFKMMSEYQDIWVQSALYSPMMIQDAVDMALALLRGETVDEVKVVPTTVVDRENCGEFLDEKSPY